MTSSVPTAFGERLRRLRQQRGRTQADLVGPGLSKSYVSLLESGRRQPTADVVRRLAELLGTTAEELLDERREQDEQLGLAQAGLELAHGHADDAVTTYTRLAASPDREVAKQARWGLAQAREASGDLEGAAGDYERIVATARQDDSPEPYLRAVLALSRCYREVGDLARAVDVGEQALHAADGYGLGASDLRVDLLCTVAAAHQERGDVVRAGQLLAQARASADGLGTPRARGAAYWNASVVAAELGATGDAVDLARRALALFGEGDDTRNLARLKNALAALQLKHAPDAPEEPLRLLHQAHETLRSVGSEVDLAYCETELARALALLGRPQEAERFARTALTRLGPSGRLETAHARQALGYALWTAGRAPEARVEYATAARHLQQLGARRHAAICWAELALLERTTGRPEEALTALHAALAAAGVGVHVPAPADVPSSAR